MTAPARVSAQFPAFTSASTRPAPSLHIPNRVSWGYSGEEFLRRFARQGLLYDNGVEAILKSPAFVATTGVEYFPFYVDGDQAVPIKEARTTPNLLRIAGHTARVMPPPLEFPAYVHFGRMWRVPHRLEVKRIVALSSHEVVLGWDERGTLTTFVNDPEEPWPENTGFLFVHDTAPVAPLVPDVHQLQLG